MGIMRLGGVRIRCLDMQASIDYYTKVIGFEVTGQDKDGNVYLKGWDEFDHHSLTLTPSNRAGLEWISLKVESPDDLVFFRNKLESAGVKVQTLPAGSEMGMGEALWFEDPGGHWVKLYAEMERVGTKVGSLNPNPWPAGLQGIGAPRLDHILLAAEDAQKSTDFYMHLLGFWMSERLVTKNGDLIAAWLFRTNTVHDIAIIAGPQGKMHHFSFLLDDWNEIRKAADVIAMNDVKIDVGPTRHGISRGLTIYFFDPSGNRNETFAGGYMPFPDSPVITWTEEEIGRGIFFFQRELNEAFTTVFT